MREPGVRWHARPPSFFVSSPGGATETSFNRPDGAQTTQQHGGGRFAYLSTGSRPRLQISRPPWGLCAAPPSHQHSLFGVPCSIFAVPFAVSAPSGRRNVAAGGAARPPCGPTRNPWKADERESFLPYSFFAPAGRRRFSQRRKHARVRRFPRGCNELYFYRITACPRSAPNGVGTHAGSPLRRPDAAGFLRCCAPQSGE